MTNEINKNDVNHMNKIMQLLNDKQIYVLENEEIKNLD